MRKVAINYAYFVFGFAEQIRTLFYSLTDFGEICC